MTDLTPEKWRQIKSLVSEQGNSESARLSAPGFEAGEALHRIFTWTELGPDGAHPFTDLSEGDELQFTIVPDGAVARQLDVDGYFRRGSLDAGLIVVFHGALDRSRYSVPRFEYLRTLRRRSESLLFLSDPTLYLHESIQLGWYVGSEIDNGHDLMATTIRNICSELNQERPLLVGSSGGGFAALAVSAQIAGSLCLAFSPQTSIDRYHMGYGRRLSTLAFPTSRGHVDLLARYIQRIDLSALYDTANPQNRVTYVQNTGDEFHLREHCYPFLPQLGLDLAHGVLASKRARLELEYMRDGHGAPSPSDMLRHIDRALGWGELSTP